MKLPEKGTVVPLSEIKRICKEAKLFGLYRKIVNDLPEKPFKSDGCSGGFPDNWKDKDGNVVCLYDLCFLHDLNYWAGHSGDSVGRFFADTVLMASVVAKTGRVGLGLLMFLGVRIGGVSWIPSPFKWSFGRV